MTQIPRAICFLLFLLFPTIVFSAGGSPIIISEIGAYETSGKEWVEVYNRSNDPVDLSSWAFVENDINHKLKLIQGSASVPVGGYAIITQKDVDFMAAYPQVSVPIFDSAWGSLKESGEEIGLRNADGDVVELFTYIPAGESALQRKSLGEDIYDASNWQEHASGNSVGLANVFAEALPEQAPISEKEPPVSTEDTPGEEIETSPTSKTKVQVTEKNRIGTRNIQTGTLLINELVSDPESGAVEFVELYNTARLSIDLYDWWIEDGSGKKTYLKKEEENRMLPRSFWLVEKPKGTLNNAGDIVLLKDGTGRIIDEVAYGNWEKSEANAPAAPDPFSLARGRHYGDTDNHAEDFFITKRITPGKRNIIRIPELPKEEADQKEIAEEKTTPQISAIQAADIIISEFIPNPEGSDTAEFIELFNKGNETIPLYGLLLDDAEGGSKPYAFSEESTIEPEEFLVISRKESALSLNNKDDAVRLLLADGTVAAEQSYGSTQEAFAYAWEAGDVWRWTDKLTPGAENEFPDVRVEKPFQQSTGGKQDPSTGSAYFIAGSLAELADTEVGDKVTVTGVVTVAQHVFSKQYLYIQDPSCAFAESDGSVVALPAGCFGVQVYMHSGSFPELRAGDAILVSGEMAEAYGERRLKTKTQEDIVFVDHIPLPNPSATEISHLTEFHMGLLLQIQGEVTEKKSSYLYIDDGAGEIRVGAKSIPKQILSQLKTGVQVVFDGVVTFRKGEFLLLPTHTAFPTGEKPPAQGNTHPALPPAASLDPQSNAPSSSSTAATGTITSFFLGFLFKARGALVKRHAKKFLLRMVQLIQKTETKIS